MFLTTDQFKKLKVIVESKHLDDSNTISFIELGFNKGRTSQLLAKGISITSLKEAKRPFIDRMNEMKDLENALEKQIESLKG